MSVSIAVKAMTKDEINAAAKARWHRMGMVRSEPAVEINPPMPVVQEARKPIPVTPPKPKPADASYPEMYFISLPTRRSSLNEIVRLVCQEYNISEIELMAFRRHKLPCAARQVAMYLAKRATHQSFPQIARFFNRDHTTVLHAVNITEIRMHRDHEFQRRVNALRSRLAYLPTTHTYWGC